MLALIIQPYPNYPLHILAYYLQIQNFYLISELFSFRVSFMLSSKKDDRVNLEPI